MFFEYTASFSALFSEVSVLLLREEAEASPSIGNTLWRVWMVFMHLAITLLEVNGFGWNLGYCEYIVCRWPWQTLGAIRAEARAGERADFFFVFFCPVNNAWLYRFLVGQISRNLHTIRGSAMWWIRSEQNFQNLLAKGCFFPKTRFLTTSWTTSDFRRPQLPNDIL